MEIINRNTDLYEGWPVKRINFNPVQLLFVMLMHAVKVGKHIWGRGTGKTTIIAWLLRQIILNMPRSAWGLQGCTFQEIQTIIWPTIKQGLESLGLREDIHFWVGSNPPKGFEKPYWHPNTPKHCVYIISPKKTTICLVFLSQDREGMNRGFNLDGVICDEALKLNIDRFNRETHLGNRGHLEYYKKVPFHHAEHFFSSMPYGTGGDYLLTDLEYYRENGQNIDLLWNSITQLQFEWLLEENLVLKEKIWAEQLKLLQQLRFFVGPKGRLLTLGNVFDNIENVGIGYIVEMYNTLPLMMFEIEVLNRFNKRVDESFYPTFDRAKHCYYGNFDYDYLDEVGYSEENIKKINCLQDKDLVKGVPLHLGFDFGGNINWIVVAQQLNSQHRLNFLKDMYVKSPKILNHVIEDFDKYYSPHKQSNKTVYIHPDASGSDKTANSEESYIDTTKRLLLEKGWKPVEYKPHSKRNPYHEAKFMLWSQILYGKDAIYPTIGFNAINCSRLITIMEKTPVTEGARGRIKKDKSSEKKLKSNREEATDVTDAADYIVFNLYGHLLSHSRFPSIGPSILNIKN